MSPPGRPKGSAPPLTDAQRKAAQRERERRRLWAGGSVAELTTAALAESLLGLINNEAMFAAVLKELGGRGGLTVTTRPRALGRSERIKP